MFYKKNYSLAKAATIFRVSTLNPKGQFKSNSRKIGRLGEAAGQQRLGFEKCIGISQKQHCLGGFKFKQ